MRLDKIMIWISIHLHSLVREHLSLGHDPLSVLRSLLLPFRISQSYARYHTNALLVPLPLRRYAHFVAVEMRHGQTSNQIGTTRCDQRQGKREGGRSRISRDRSANESGVYPLLLLFIYFYFLFPPFEDTCTTLYVWCMDLKVLKLKVHAIQFSDSVRKSSNRFVSYAYNAFRLSIYRVTIPRIASCNE